MERSNGTRLSRALIATAMAVALSGCGLLGSSEAVDAATTKGDELQVVEQGYDGEATVEESSEAVGAVPQQDAAAPEASSPSANVLTASLESMTSDGVIDTADLFSDRDLEQEADLSDAVRLTVTSGQDVLITEEGTYVLSGNAEGATITVNVDSTEKVQLVLDGLSITNGDAPAIYVISADKVFVTTASGTDNVLSVADAFVADGEANTDAVIFSKDDLVLNGLGTLTINSTDNAVTSKDDLKITGGTYVINCASDALEANDSIRIADGDFSITTQKDGLHAENDDDDSLGYVYICGGTFDIEAGDDGIQATTYLQIDGGTFDVSAGEAFEATYVQINGGDITLNANDDGINASWKSQSVGNPTIDIRGGNISVTMAQGDTDALDSNGYLYVSGGTIDISAQFAFDFEYGSEFTGGTIYVNGEQVNEIAESMMGGPGGGFGGPGDFGGGPGGW